MKHEDFKDWIEKNCMYETFYEDSEGRTIMILTELDAWAMCNKFAETKETLETKDEPVAWEQFHEHMAGPNYVAPQQTWVGLTEEDLKPICDEWRIVYGAWTHDFAREIEAKLKEKNT